VRWSDGTPITAADFVYSLRRGLNPVLASRNAYLAYDIVYAEAYNEGGVFARDAATGTFVADPEHPALRLILPGEAGARMRALQAPALTTARNKTYVPVRAEDVGVDAMDDSTLRIRLMRPVPFLLGLMTHQFFRPVPRQSIERYGDTWTQPGHIVTSGAFTLQSWRPYDKIVVARSPTFWDAATVHLDRITFFAVEDFTTMLNLYKAGEVDALYNHTVPLSWIDRMRTYKDYMDAPENANEYYGFNTSKPPMNDVRVRRAFNMAIDKVGLARYRRAQPIAGFTPPIVPGYPAVAGDAFDPAKAQALLAEAGYATNGQYDPAKFPVGSVSLTYNTADTNRMVAEFVQQQWKANLGLTVTIRNMEWKTFLATRAAVDYAGVARFGWVGDYLDPYSFLNIFSTPHGDNGTAWWDPRYVALLEAANRESDPARRYAKLAEAERMLLDAAPIIPLFSTSTDWVKKPYVKGMYANPLTLFPWKDVYIEHDPARWGN
jgi:oligopeptide transport system substrate-binding protein